MSDDPDSGLLPDNPILFQHDLAVTLATTLQRQAERLVEQGLEGTAFEKSVADGVMAVARAAEKLASLLLLTRQEDDSAEANNMADLSAFFKTAEEQIDQRARERAAALVAQTAGANCPSCGAEIWPAGSA